MARLITKGLIGLEDIATGTSTFTRATSTGGTQVLTQVNSTNLIAVPPLFSSFNEVLFVGADFNTVWGSSDIGAQINAAYAALPATGGKIYICPKSNGSRYDFSTNILFTTSGKYVMLEGYGSAGATAAQANVVGCVLNYTPTSGSAIKVDYVPVDASPLSSSHGLSNFTLLNNGKTTTGSATGTAIGVEVGTSFAGHCGSTQLNFSIIGFPTAYKNVNSLSVQVSWINPQCFSNNAVFRLGAITGFWLFGGQIAGNGQAFVGDSTNSTSEIGVVLTEFFSNGVPLIDFTNLTGTNRASFDSFGAHFERNGANGHFIDGLVDINIHGGVIEDTTPSVSHTSLINASGNSVNIFGTRIGAGSGSTISAIVTANSPVRGRISATLISPTSFTAFVDGANAGSISTEILNGSSSTTIAPWRYEAPFAFNGQASDPSGIAGYTLVHYNGITGQFKSNINNAGALPIPQVIASGTSTLTSGSISATTSQAAVTTAATGAATTDAIEWSYATAPTGTTDALLTINPYCTSNNVNFVRSNPTNGSVVGTAIVINWRVIR